MPYTFSDEAIASACATGLKDAVRQQLSNGYSIRDKLDAALKKAVNGMEGVIASELRAHIVEALHSPEMQGVVRKAIGESVANKLGGALQGVMIAAAKRLADDPEMRDAMVNAARATLLNKE